MSLYKKKSNISLVTRLPNISRRLSLKSQNYNFIKVITEDTSRHQFPKFTINRRTLRSSFTVVNCQLSRWRLFPTAQTMKKARDMGGRKEMELSWLQWDKEPIPTFPYTKQNGYGQTTMLSKQMWRNYSPRGDSRVCFNIKNQIWETSHLTFGVRR